MKLQYRESGDTTKPAMLILHGLFGSSDNWLTTSKAFADRFRVIMPDARNHGRSPHHEKFSYSLMADDILELMNDLSISETLMIGHSMGGKTTMNFASRYPDRLTGMVIVDIAPRYYPPHHQSVLAGFHAIPVKTLESRQQAEEILSQHVRDLGVRQFMLKNLYREENGSFAWRMNLDILTREIEQIGTAQEFTQPVTTKALFMRGAKSDYVNEADAVQIKSLFPYSELATVPGAGHWIQAEKPVEFVDLVNQFIAKL